jgi:tetratricopeptide (TPR) repeat protein
MLGRYEQDDPGGFRAKPTQPDLASVRGEIALAENKPQDALREFRSENPLNGTGAVRCDGCMAFDLARAFDAAGNADSALAEYQRYLTIPLSLRRDADDLAAVQKRLGELYDQRGDAKNAIVHYTAFVDQWAHADADLQPVVNDVRKRLGELRSREGN